MDKSLWPKMAEVSNGAFFCTTELSTQGKMKWTLVILMTFSLKLG